MVRSWQVRTNMTNIEFVRSNISWLATQPTSSDTCQQSQMDITWGASNLTWTVGYPTTLFSMWYVNKTASQSIYIGIFGINNVFPWWEIIIRHQQTGWCLPQSPIHLCVEGSLHSPCNHAAPPVKTSLGLLQLLLQDIQTRFWCAKAIASYLQWWSCDSLAAWHAINGMTFCWPHCKLLSCERGARRTAPLVHLKKNRKPTEAQTYTGGLKTKLEDFFLADSSINLTVSFQNKKIQIHFTLSLKRWKPVILIQL